MLAPTDLARVRARKSLPSILVLYFFFALASATSAVPLATWVDRMWGPHPLGDRILGEPGAAALLTLVRAPGPALSIVETTTLIALVLALLIAPLPSAALWLSLARGAAPVGAKKRHDWADAASLWLPLLWLLMVSVTFQGLIVGFAFRGGGLLQAGLVRRFGDRSTFEIRTAIVVAGAAVAIFIQIAFDLVRAALVWEHVLRGRGPPIRALARACAVAVRARGAIVLLLVGWFTRIGLGTVIAFASLLPCGALQRWTVLLIATHQFVCFGRIALLASWRAYALRTVAPLLLTTPRP